MQLAGLNIGIVADDMTGANDTALQFFMAGAKTQVILDPDNPPKVDEKSPASVLSLNTNSRHLDANIAEAVVRKSVALLRDTYGVENFYKKIDSTLRGHIAHECLGFLDELKADCVLIAPAFPQEDRRTVGGYQLVQGMPVEKTSVARDPLFPMRQSHLPTMLEQATTPNIVGYISLSTVLKGAAPILSELSALIENGKKLVVVDAASAEDMEQIALAFEKIQKSAKVLPCGSAGFAQALTRYWMSSTAKEEGTLEAKPELATNEPPILIVSGSNNTTTRQQVMQLIENYTYYGEGSNLEIFSFTPDKILGLIPADEDIAKIVTALDGNNTVVISTSIKEDSYTQTLELAKEHDLTDRQAAFKAQDLLAYITKQVLRQKEVKLVLTGGETAFHTCKALDLRGLTLLDEVEPAIPLVQDDKGRGIVTKSGTFGSPNALANVVRYLKQKEVIHA